MILTATGHRPLYMPCKFNEEDPWCKEKKQRLKDYLVQKKPDLIITGMAMGWDTWVAEAAFELKIPFDAYIPFENQGKNWEYEHYQRRNKLLFEANSIVLCSLKYSRDCFDVRDQRMVDDGDKIIALWSGIKKGGTYATVKMAKKQKKEIINFW